MRPDAPTFAGGRGHHAPDLPACLAALDDGLAAAMDLGLDTSGAEAVRDEAVRRLGAGADAWVLALVGGTGVGKSSLLNALAGQVVTPAGAIRPTTSSPVAWVERSAAARVAPMLEPLGPTERRLHDEPDLARVVVLDLPDVDSLEPAHREAVDALLPRVDAVAWVTDPEKYADALLHDDLMRRWLPRLDRQVVLVNKADRLRDGDLSAVRGHLARLVADDAGETGRSRPAVVALTAAAGPGGVVPLRDWLIAEADAKAVVVGRLAASAADAVRSLAAQAGAAGEAGRQPLVDPARRRRALDAATAEALRVIDLAEARRQAVAATRARARRRGAGPLGWLTSAAYRASGRERRVADPRRHLAGWRSRGGLARAAEPVTDLVLAAVAGAPAALRPRLAATGDPAGLERRLGAAIDRVVASAPSAAVPSSRLWPAIGVLATATVLAVAFGVAWLLTWLVARPPVDSVTLPFLGAVPAPLAFLALALLLGLVPPRLLALHAGWLGDRWAARLAAGMRESLEAAVADTAFAPLDRVEASRRALWLADRAAETACA